MKILITGMNGFVGSMLSQSLIELKHEVYGMDLINSGKNNFSVDIADFKSVFRSIKDIAPDFIFHLAAISRVDFYDLNKIFETNITGTSNILSASIKIKKTPKILFVSSSHVYGNVEQSSQPISEDLMMNPVNFYGASKAAAENIVKAFHHEFGLPVTIARPFNHTGRTQPKNFVIPKIINAFRERLKDIELGNINVVRDFLDVRDVVNAYIKLMNNFQDGKVLNIASGKGYSIAEIISLLEKRTGHKINIIKRKDLLRNNEISTSIGSYKKIKDLLNWKPIHSISETLDWMLS